MSTFTCQLSRISENFTMSGILPSQTPFKIVMELVLQYPSYSAVDLARPCMCKMILSPIRFFLEECHCSPKFACSLKSGNTVHNQYSRNWYIWLRKQYLFSSNWWDWWLLSHLTDSKEAYPAILLFVLVDRLPQKYFYLYSCQHSCRKTDERTP